MKLTDNIYMVAGPVYGTHQNVYAVRADGLLILIDTGKDLKDIEIILENFNYWGLSKFPVKKVLLTHAHYEHSANAAYWRKHGAEIIIGKNDADGIETGDDRTAYYAFTQSAMFTPCVVDRRLQGNEILELSGVKIQVIHTPGHSAGSVVYLLDGEKKALFSGDTVLVTDFCQHAALGWTGGIDFDRDVLYDSLRKLTLLDIDILLPGHGEICMHAASALLLDAYVQIRLKLIAPMQTIGKIAFSREDEEI